MSENIERIPFRVEVGRIIEVLARQIYQSPLALLRENTQNAFDAILLRRILDDQFEGRIDVLVSPTEIQISDNGIGMTPEDLRNHYWRAGASSKNTAEARQAGVVGTFGIGAMANFGIADELIVETESAITGQRTRSAAEKATLSTTEETISLEPLKATGSPGTSVIARIPESAPVNVDEANAYISDFVAYVDIAVAVNGALVSRKPISTAVKEVGGRAHRSARADLGGGIQADVTQRVGRTGDVWARLTRIRVGGQDVSGEIILRQGLNAIRTFRSGFGLAVVSASSHYQFGGIANVSALEPTAGREALTTESMQLLQTVVSGLDSLVSERIASMPEADSNLPFMQWVRQQGRYDLCGQLRVRVEPLEDRVSLAELRKKSEVKPLLVYSGADPTIIQAYASDDSPLVVLAREQPRRDCESQFLLLYSQTQAIQDSPTIIREKKKSNWSLSEQALAFRILTILESDYFLSPELGLGELSHGLPIIVEGTREDLRIVLDPEAPTFSLIRELYDSDFAAFGSMAKDFVRNVVFPRVSDFVPSSTREGAEAFLKTIRRTRDVFEYERADLDSLSSVWEEYAEGRLSMSEAAARATLIVQRNVQVLDSSASASMRDVVPDVVENQAAIATEPTLGPAPPILRTESASGAKLLTIEPGEPSIAGYRCFLALSDRIREERGEFFLQPHSTSVVWGGQKALFIFEHHSGEFGLYYDLQASQVIATESGGGPFPTATIVLKDRTYIPIPEAIAISFIPSKGERKRFEVRGDLLYSDVPRTTTRKSPAG